MIGAAGTGSIPAARAYRDGSGNGSVPEAGTFGRVEQDHSGWRAAGLGTGWGFAAGDSERLTTAPGPVAPDVRQIE
ncbi:hypothetical protein GCM10010185_70290 [Saccharothrix coeruleofusca]|uniref:Uncharacterized protein n=1 Tax=Saccharothrix coeruleofusca TaxID=33919 RepID=A0A918EI05_9PSEU|nr:hypothetical protein GCM10010185_70290 [Saccharothrix coeruleofusca]